MQDNTKITYWIKENLSEKRFKHTLGVADTARSLAMVWGADADKAYLAGLLHDCAKEIPKREAISRLREAGYSVSDIERRTPALLHAPLGKVFARGIFGVCDEDVLNSVRYHTTGREGMSLLEKIIYVADFAEPNRDYDGIEEIRILSTTDLDKAALKGADLSLIHTIKRGAAIHVDTIAARNYFLKNTNEVNFNEG